jgi:hypothetical protein
MLMPLTLLLLRLLLPELLAVVELHVTISGCGSWYCLLLVSVLTTVMAAAASLTGCSVLGDTCVKRANKGTPPCHVL